MSIRESFLRWLGAGVSTSRLSRADAPSREMTPLGYGWKSMGFNAIPFHDTFDNLFPYTTAIANRFSSVVPYAIGADGERMDPQPAALQALYTPNSMFSYREFAHFIAQSILTQPYLDILVWTSSGDTIVPGGDIKPDNIAGYTFLPQGSREYSSNRSTYTVQADVALPDGDVETRTFTQNEIISLAYSRHPVDPTRTVSPGMTVSKWASVDDFIADYERGYFCNGAVPAGMLSIVANDPQDFQRNKQRIEDSFRGADNANGVLYNMVPVDPSTNKPSDVSKISWTPFQQANDSLDLASLDDIVNRRMANALAVPDIVRGIDSGQTYANAEQAERTFVDNTLHPLLLSVWDKFKFELDRLTGGLGYDITFDLDVPTRTDEEKAKADTENVKATTFLALVNNGGDPVAVAKALGLDDSWGRLGVKMKDTTPALNINPGSAVNALPKDDDPSDDDENDLAEIGSLLSTSKKGSVRLSDGFSYRIRPSERVSYYMALGGAKKALRRIISQVRSDSFASGGYEDPYGVISTELSDAMLEALVPQVKAYAEKTGKPLMEAVKEYAATHPDVQAILDSYGVDVSKLYVWDELPADYHAAYQDRVTHVADDFTANGRNAIQELLAEANANEWTENDIEKALNRFVDGDRAKLIAVNEMVNAQRIGSLFSAEALSTNLSVKMVKVWNTTASDPCPFCAAQNGKAIPLEESFMPVGGVQVIDGRIYANDFVDMQTPSGHPRCRCVATFKVVDE